MLDENWRVESGYRIVRNATAVAAGFYKLAELGSGLIYQLFNTRSRAVLGLQSSQHSSSYLSGLLLGCEVGGVAPKLRTAEDGEGLVHLICAEYLAEPYRRALAFYDLDCRHYSGGVYSAKGLLDIARTRGLV